LFTACGLQQLVDESLRYVHRHEVIHKDIKPEGILFGDLNRQSFQVIDFGKQSRFYRASDIYFEGTADIPKENETGLPL
jgi:serine/threonine protein kinase